jgi:hypothetical protein
MPCVWRRRVIRRAEGMVTLILRKRCELAALAHRVCVHARWSCRELEESASTNCGIVDTGGLVHGADTIYSGSDVPKTIDA